MALACALLLIVFGARLVDASARNSFTIDEPHYFTKGLYLWQSGDYHWFDTLMFQPPLAFHLASLPLLALDLGGFEPGRDAGLRLVESAETPLTGLRVASRLPFVLISCWGALLAFLWAREVAGDRAGLLALLLFSASPTLAAYGPLIHSDTAVSVFFFQTLYTFWRWWRAPSPGRAALCGLSLGLALATKASAVLLPPLLAACLARLAWRRRDAGALPLRRAVAALAGMGLVALAGMGLVALAVLWLAYGGSLRFHPVELGPFGTLPIPDYLELFLFTGRIAQEPRPYWFFGELQVRSHWYVLPAGFLLKTPLPVLILAGFAALRRSRAFRAAELGPVLGLPALGYAAVACFAMQVPQGVRFLLPLYPMLFLFIATRLADVAGRGSRALLGVCALWLVGISAWIHPHYIAYFNELIGGRERAHEYFADSNLDWGQSLPALAGWLDERGNPPVRTALFAVQRPEAFGIRSAPLEGCLPPRGGLVAISAAVLRGVHASHNLLARPPPGCYAWLAGREPVGMPGYSILVYDLDAAPARPRAR